MYVQQGELQVFIPSSFSDGLTSYLSCNDAGYSSVLLCLLRDFISSLKCCDTSCKGEKKPKTNKNYGSRSSWLSSLTPGDSCR